MKELYPKFFTTEAYWKKDRLAIRDVKLGVDQDESFDLWGNWNAQQVERRVGSTQFFDIEEGSGRAMNLKFIRYLISSTVVFLYLNIMI